MRRAVPVLGLVLAWGMAGALPAQAHAEFEAKAVPPDAETTVQLNVPHERDEATYNVEVSVAVPEGWQAVTCARKETWTCSVGESNGAVLVTFRKEEGSARDDAQDQAFEFTVLSPGAGATGAFKTHQVYNSGEAVDWSGPPGSDTPAALLRTEGPPPDEAAPPAAGEPSVSDGTVPGGTVPGEAVPRE